MKTVIIIALCALAGCSTYEQRVAAHCARLGFPPGDPHYYSCVENTEALDQRNREMWSGATMAGASLMRPQPNFYVFPRY